MRRREFFQHVIARVEQLVWRDRERRGDVREPLPLGDPTGLGETQGVARAAAALSIRAEPRHRRIPAVAVIRPLDQANTVIGTPAAEFLKTLAML